MNIRSEPPFAVTPERPVMSAADILAAAEGLVPKLSAAVDRCEELGCLPQDVLEDLRVAGVFRIGFPVHLGGPEMRLVDQVRLMAILSEANPSVGWTVMILADSGFFAGRFDPQVAREIWPCLDMPTSALRRPPARAEEVEGGYRLSGRFGFASGIRNADRISMPCFRYVDGQPVLDAKGQPELCVAFPPIEAVVIHDTWDTIGLRGTGSHQVSVENAFVPRAHLIPHSVDAPLLSAAPLSRYVNLMYINQLGVILGVAKALLRAIEARFVGKMTPDRTALNKEYRVRTGMPHAWGLYQAACAYVYEVAAECDAKIFADEPIPPAQIAKVVTMAVIAPELCRKAVDGALDLVGTDQIFRSTGIDRLYADLRVASTHVLHKRESLQKAAAWLDVAAAQA